jgi:TctA family transporter
MITFEFLFQGILVAMQPMNLLYALIGVTLGTAVGVLARHRPGADRGACCCPSPTSSIRPAR